MNVLVHMGILGIWAVTNLGSLNSYKIMDMTDTIDTCCQARFSTIFQLKPCHSVSSFEISIAHNFTQIIIIM